MSDSVRPHRQQPTRLPCPWDSPGKNTGVGCHFLLHLSQLLSCVCVCSVTQSCPTLCDPMNCSYPGFSVQGILQARILEWVVISYSRRSSWLRERTWVSCIGRQILCHWATWEAQLLSYHYLIVLFHLILPKYFNSYPFTDISIVGQSCLLLFYLFFGNLSC